MTATATMHYLSTIAAAGLGRKASAATVTTAGTTVATATNGEVWVEVWADADPGDPEGAAGTVTPRPEETGRTAGVAFSGRDLRRIIAGVVPATDTESSRYALGGTLVEVAEGSLLVVVGTDGRRMHVGHVQPSEIHGQAMPIVRAGQWLALDAALRAAGRRIIGASGRRLEAAIDAGTVYMTVGTYQPTGGEVVTLEWRSATLPDTGRPIVIRAHAVAVAGRFPRWRDCLPENAPPAWQKPQQRATLDVAAVAGAVAEYGKLDRAAERAGRTAWKAEQEENKRRRRYHGGEYRHPIGIICRPDGMTGTGVEWSSAVPAAAVPVRLDHRYLAAAFAAAAAWGAQSVEAAGSDESSASTFSTGDCGARFLAIIMPLAAG